MGNAVRIQHSEQLHDIEPSHSGRIAEALLPSYDDITPCSGEKKKKYASSSMKQREHCHDKFHTAQHYLNHPHLPQQQQHQHQHLKQS